MNQEMIPALRRQIIEKEFADLNEQQREAVLHVKGPLLVLAGAGSGKTTVLVNRAAHILRWGEAYESDCLYGEYSDEDIAVMQQAANGECRLPDELADRLSVGKVYPWRILAITFTNKAANELKERIVKKVGTVGAEIWASTFHSACMRILRRYGTMLGYEEHFTIYDTDDQKRVIRDCMKVLQIDDKIIPIKSVLPEISQAKDHQKSPEQMKKEAGKDDRLISIAKIYKEYQKRLLAANAMDFDDIIYNTVELFEEFPDILEKYQEQFRYIMVDEYQDTNTIQYKLVKMLADKQRNLCVVGDDDQSIYKFRGAMSTQILMFDKEFQSHIIKLEQNYRSTKNILTAANSIIKNNSERHEKSLWTQNETGDNIIRYTASDELDEARFIADTIKKGIENGGHYTDYAVLYRMNTQSQAIERTFLRNRLPYRIIGGRRFFEYREIRDMMAYLNIISNPHDDNRLKRIINIPKRGIGDKTISQLEEISAMLGQSMFETMRQSDQFEALSKSRDKLDSFVAVVDRMRTLEEEGTPVSEMYEELVKAISYDSFIRGVSERGEAAVDNVHELTSNIMQYEHENGNEASLQGFLESTMLLTDIDSYQEQEDKVVMMTVHSAKGLEFNTVFLPGMEENLFPSFQAIMSDGDMQEERRLAYVAVTRAKQHLFLSSSDSRMLFGHTTRNRPSRFLKEMPEQLIEKKHKEIVRDPSVEIPAPKAARREEIARSKVISSAALPKVPLVAYQIGMRVLHKSFGEGVILNVKPMASDSMLEIAFDKAGTKKLMGNVARLTVLD